MNIDKILNDPGLKNVRPEVRNELVKLSKMVDGKPPMEVFTTVVSFQRKLEAKGLLNPQEKAILTRVIESSLSPDEKRKVMNILSVLKNRV